MKTLRCCHYAGDDVDVPVSCGVDTGHPCLAANVATQGIDLVFVIVRMAASVYAVSMSLTAVVKSEGGRGVVRRIDLTPLLACVDAEN
jgi:hypothetical protein